MTGADLMVVGAIIVIAWILWRQDETEHWRDWLIKTLLISSLLAGPLFLSPMNWRVIGVHPPTGQSI